MGGTGRGLAVPCHQSNLAWEAQTDVRDLVSRMYDAAMGHKFFSCLGAVKILGSFRRRERIVFHSYCRFFGWLVRWLGG